MKLNKILLVAIFLLAVITLTPLCASDENATDDLSISDEGDTLHSTDVEVLADDGDEDGDDAVYNEEREEYLRNHPPIDLKVSKPSKMYVDNPTKITFTGSDKYTGKILVKVDGKTYSGKYANGKATVNIKASKTGTKSIRYSTNIDDGEDVSGSFKITAVKKPILKANDVTMVTHESKYCEIRLFDGNSKALGGKNVAVYVDSKKVKTIKTDKYGYGYLTLSKVAIGKHKLIFKYDGVEFTKKLTSKSLFKSYKAVSVKNAKKMTLELKTNKVNGKYLAGKTVKINVVGKTYKAKIDSNGAVKLSIAKNAFSKCLTKKDSNYFAQISYGKDAKWLTFQFSKVKPKLSYTIKQ